MAGPPWLAAALAAIMLLTAACSASLLVTSARRRAATGADAQGLHVLMGVSMAGMLVPPLTVLPATAWTVAFGAGAAWFAAGAIRPRGTVTGWQCRHCVPRLIECGAMLYMLWFMPARGHEPGMAMPGMGSGTPDSFPVLAIVLALYLIGYTVWTTDQLTALTRARLAAAPAVTRTADRPIMVTAAAAGRPGAPEQATRPDSAAGPPDPGAGPADPGARIMPASWLSAGSELAMSIAMGYLLILML